jgi:biopolymer transport protein ExbD
VGFDMRNRFKKKHAASGDMELNITAMADIFTIILVFLLKSYATGAIDIAPTKGLLMPEAEAAFSKVEALQVEVSEASVLIDSKPTAQLTNFSFPSSDVRRNGSSFVLSKVMESQRRRQISLAKADTGVKIDPKIMIIADQRVPYKTIKTVLASAALSGYTDFKLAVIRKE